MKRIVLCLALLLAFLMAGTASQKAEAQGFHFQTRRVHVDVGRSHGYYGGGNYWSGGYGSAYHGGYGGAYDGGYRSYGHSDWHDTTHLDYHPGRYQGHYNHIDYAPRHYDVHSSGHWDPHF